MSGDEVMSAVLQSTYPLPASAGVQEEVMSAALQSTYPSSSLDGEVVTSAVLQSTYPASPSSIPEVTSAVLQSTYPSGPHTGWGHAYKSGTSECFCELTPHDFCPATLR